MMNDIMNDNVIQNIVNDKIFNDNFSISQSDYSFNLNGVLKHTLFLLVQVWLLALAPTNFLP